MNPAYPKIVPYNDELYILDQDYVCILDNLDMLKVKAGFLTDGASIPRFAWSIIGNPFSGTHLRASFVHDALYAAEIYDRKTCDEIFLLEMKSCGTGFIKRNIMWAAVRMFGDEVWRKHTPRSIKSARKLVEVIKR